MNIFDQMASKTVKETVIEYLNSMPDDASWEDIEYNIYVQKNIAAGLKDMETGRTLSHQEIKKQFNIS